MRVHAYLLLFAVFEKLCESENVPGFIDLIHEKTGNVTVVGLFDGSSSNECHLQSLKSLEEIASAIWIVEALNKYEYLPGLTIGLTVFESCGKENENINLLDIEKYIRLNTTSHNTGFITTLQIDKSKYTTEEGVGYIVQILHIVDEFTLVEMIVQVLINLQCMIVKTIVAESDDILNFFSEKARSEGIYTYNQILTNDERFASYFQNATDPEEPEMIVIISKYEKIKSFIQTNEKFLKSMKMILAPTDFVFNPVKGLPKKSLILLPTVGKADLLRDFIHKREFQKDFLNHREPTKSPLFFGVAAAILKALSPIKKLAKDPCGNTGNSSSASSCPPFLDFESNSTVVFQPGLVSFENVSIPLETLKLNEKSNGEMFLYLGHLANEPTSEDAAIFQVYNLKTKTSQPVLLKINARVFDEDESQRKEAEVFGSESINLRTFSPQEITGMERLDHYEMGNDERNDSHPVNFDFHITKKNESSGLNANGFSIYPGAVWRSSTWVILNTCLGFTGLLSVLFVMSFMVHRICRSNALEGSPIFIILLIIAVSFLFAASLCYHFDPLPETVVFICTCRALGPGLVYSVLFSLMLSRSIMLAFSENQNEFISHVNGYLQSILFLCLLGVQIATTSQRWMYEGVINYSLTCLEVHSDKTFMVSLIYDCILLSVLVVIGPFIIRLQRNYKEGLLLALGAFFVAAVSSVWISCYHFLPADYRDAAVALGMNTTGWALLLFAFFPRVYMIIMEKIRSRNTTCISSLHREVLPKVTDVHYKTNDLPLDGDLCETFNVGIFNPNFIQ